jgi:hypothetical protein
MKIVFPIILIIFFIIKSLYAGPLSESKTLGVSAGVGVPEFIYGEVSLLKIKSVIIGFNYGMLPINYITNKVLDIETLTAPIAITESINISPRPNSSLRTYSFFIKYMPWEDSSFYIGAQMQGLRINGSVSGSVSNAITGRYITSVSANIDFKMPMAGIIIGYNFFLFDSVFMDMGLGVSYILEAKKTLTLGGISLAAYDDAIYQQILDEQTNISNEIDAKLQEFVNKLKVIPVMFFSLGYAF